MAVFTKIKPQFYQDSLKLMRVSAEVKETPGIKQAFAFMATEINKKTRMQAHLMSDEVKQAKADDLVLLVECDDNELGKKILDEFEVKITSSVQAKGDNDEDEALPATFEQGAAQLDANLAVISIPGPYAAVQTMLALRNGMNVHLFSDNVSIEEEIEIKDYAKERGLIVMGPDCGTSIISGVPICFANVVSTGNVGVIGASGTGLQEFTVLLDKAGCGITHAIGVGGRDLSEEVAGRTTLSALELLINDESTKIIAIVSKPPAQLAGEKIIEAVKKSGKPAVLAFLGAQPYKVSDSTYIVGTIEEAAAKTVAIVRGQNPDNATVLYERKLLSDKIKAEMGKLSAQAKQVKGLFTGGTLASEAKYILKNVSSSIIDLGDDEYTRGSLHPMIDPSNRSQHVSTAFSDPTTAVLLCDVVIGYGSHQDPAGMLAEDVKKAREESNSNVIVIASVTGTDKDPQNMLGQVKTLEDAGIFVLPSNQYAAEVAAEIVKQL